MPRLSWLHLNRHSKFQASRGTIWDRQWCKSLLSKRVAEASALIRAIGRYRVPHGAFTMLRSCAGWAQILCSCRTVPPSLQSGGLAPADFETRDTLDRLFGSPLSDDDWHLGISSKGIGAHSDQEDVRATYTATPSATTNLSRRIWSAFEKYDIDSGCVRSDAEFKLRSRFPDFENFADEFERCPPRSRPTAIKLRFTRKPTLFSTSILVLGVPHVNPQLFGHTFASPQPTAPSRMATLGRGRHLSCVDKTQDP